MVRLPDALPDILHSTALHRSQYILHILVPGKTTAYILLQFRTIRQKSPVLTPAAMYSGSTCPVPDSEVYTSLLSLLQIPFHPARALSAPEAPLLLQESTQKTHPLLPLQSTQMFQRCKEFLYRLHKIPHKH